MLQQCLDSRMAGFVIYNAPKAELERERLATVLIVVSERLMEPDNGLVQMDPVTTLQDDVELITTDPGDHIVMAQALMQNLHSCLQRLVTDRMAKAIVDLLEMVNIGCNHCQILFRSGLGQFAGDQFFKMAPVQSPCEVIRGQVIIDDVLVDEQHTQGRHGPGHSNPIKQDLEDRANDGKCIVSQEQARHLQWNQLAMQKD